MANLKKREIIILIIAGLFVLYAVYEYLIAGYLPAKKPLQPDSETVKIESLIAGLTGDLAKNKLSEYEHSVIKKTGEDWRKSPFLSRELYRAWLAKDGKAVASFKIIYSGYVDTGRKKMAVLNDVEYRIGEELREEGLVLKNITPNKVFIFDKRAGSSFEIPIQE